MFDGKMMIEMDKEPLESVRALLSASGRDTVLLLVLSLLRAQLDAMLLRCTVRHRRGQHIGFRADGR